jgi:ribosomal protein S18 acetylase RimI-like enzyme
MISFKKMPALTQAILESVVPGYTSLRSYRVSRIDTSCELTFKLVGEIQNWNSSLAIREFGTHPEVRRQGIGRKLISKAIEEARVHNLTSIACETQNTNVGAVEFYKRLGFTIEGLDVTFCGPQCQNPKEIALFLRKEISDPK